jgi:hypothetical protein
VTLSQARAALRERLTTLDHAKANLVACLADAVRMADYRGVARLAQDIVRLECGAVEIRRAFEVLDQVDQGVPSQTMPLGTVGEIGVAR